VVLQLGLDIRIIAAFRGAAKVKFAPLVRLAAMVVFCHNCNLFEFDAIDLKERYWQYQGRCRQAGTFSFERNIVYRARYSGLLRNAIGVPCRRCEMNHPTSMAELHNRLGAPSSEAIECLRLLKAFLRLKPRQRLEIVDLVERLAAGGSPVPRKPPS
jgi:hypothetical protein